MNIAVIRRTVATLLRGVGYTMALLAWLWVAVIVVPPLIQNGSFDSFFPEPVTTVPLPHPDVPAGLSPFATILVVIITFIIIIVTVVTLWRLPKVVTTGGDKMVEKAANVALPVVTHHKKLPPAYKKQLNRKLIFLTQLAICIVPSLIVIWLQPPGELTRAIVIAIGAGSTCAGVVAFSLAYVVDKPILRIR